MTVYRAVATAAARIVVSADILDEQSDTPSHEGLAVFRQSVGELGRLIALHLLPGGVVRPGSVQADLVDPSTARH